MCEALPTARLRFSWRAGRSGGGGREDPRGRRRPARPRAVKHAPGLAWIVAAVGSGGVCKQGTRARIRHVLERFGLQDGEARFSPEWGELEAERAGGGCSVSCGGSDHVQRQGDLTQCRSQQMGFKGCPTCPARVSTGHSDSDKGTTSL